MKHARTPRRRTARRITRRAALAALLGCAPALAACTRIGAHAGSTGSPPAVGSMVPEVRDLKVDVKQPNQGEEGWSVTLMPQEGLGNDRAVVLPSQSGPLVALVSKYYDESRGNSPDSPDSPDAALMSFDPADGSLTWARLVRLPGGAAPHWEADLGRLDYQVREAAGRSAVAVSPDGRHVCVIVRAYVSSVLSEHVSAAAVLDAANGQVVRAEEIRGFVVAQALTDDAPPRALLACARRAAVLLPLYDVLRAQMVERGAEVLFTDLEMPVAALLAQMEDAGIAVDDAVLAERETELDARVTRAAQDAWAAAGHELNLSSPKQLQAVLFDELKMPKTRKTKTGYTTDAEALAGLYAKTSHPFLAGLLEHRDAIKLRQTVEGLRRAIQPDGRIHTTFQQTIAATGRLSSTDPNLQNIPARHEEGMRIREAFTVGEGYECLMTADYSQIEMRIMAHLSADQALIEAFRSGEDLHRYVAALVHGIDVEDVTAQQRSHVKAMSYGLAYGLSTFGLARQLGIDNAEAADLRNAYFARFGKVHDYLESVVEQARRDGYTETMFGRRRYLPDLTSDNRQRREMAERAALNAPIQGSAADIVKKAMIDVDSALREQALTSRILLQIHDELLIEVAPGEAEAVENLLKEQMGGAAELSVPLDVAVGRGRTWREAAH